MTTNKQTMSKNRRSISIRKNIRQKFRNTTWLSKDRFNYRYTFLTASVIGLTASVIGHFIQRKTKLFGENEQQETTL